jgi:hypothetical protein
VVAPAGQMGGGGRYFGSNISAFFFFLFSLKGVPDRFYFWRNTVDVEVQELGIMKWEILAAGCVRCGPVGCTRFLCIVGGGRTSRCGFVVQSLQWCVVVL